MGSKRTPPLSPKKASEVYEEMSRPPEDTPQRRMMFERARAMGDLRKRLVEDGAHAARS